MGFVIFMVTQLKSMANIFSSKNLPSKNAKYSSSSVPYSASRSFKNGLSKHNEIVGILATLNSGENLL